MDVQTLPHLTSVKAKGSHQSYFDCSYRDHTNRLFKQKCILPLDDLIKFSILKFMHKFKHGKLPFSLTETWVSNRVRNPNLDLRNAENLYIPARHLASVKRFPIFAFPKIWNEAAKVKIILLFSCSKNV